MESEASGLDRGDRDQLEQTLVVSWEKVRRARFAEKGRRRLGDCRNDHPKKPRLDYVRNRNSKSIICIPAPALFIPSTRSRQEIANYLSPQPMTLIVENLPLSSWLVAVPSLV